MEFWNPQYERINLLMLHYAWINSTAISDYSDYKHIVIADKNADGINNVIANKPHTYGYVSIGDYADTGTWETNKKAEFDVWTETYDVNVFMDDIDTAYMGTGFLPRFINLTEHIRETRGKKVILNSYTNYDEVAVYGDSVMKESAIARWSGEVNDPTYAWETPSVDVVRANFFALHNVTVVGISFGAIDDYERLAYCSNAFAVIYGFDGYNSWRYSQPNFQYQTEVFIYDYGEMIEANFTETSATDWNRLYENGRIHINPVDHTYWIENDLVVNSFDVSFHVYDPASAQSGDGSIYIYLNGSDNDPYSIPFDAPGWGWYNRSASVNIADYSEHGHYMFYAYTRSAGGGWTNLAYSDVPTSGGQHTWFDTTSYNLPATFTDQTWQVTDSQNPDINYHTWIDINVSRSKYLNPIDKIDQTSTSADSKMTTNISSDNSYPMTIISAPVTIDAESTAKTYFKAPNATWIEASVNTVTDITLNNLNWAYTSIEGLSYGAVKQAISATEYIYRYLFPELSSMEAYTEEIPTYIAPNPTTLASTTGNFWVNHTYAAGSGNVTDSYNISVNGVWYNTTTDLFYNDTYSAHDWQNITVYAYNSSGAGRLSAGSVSDNKQIPNNVPVLSDVSPSYNLYENETLSIDASHTDADSDTITYSDNSPDWDINPSTGVVSWVLDWEDVAGSPYSCRITIDDGEGGTDYQDFTVTINGMQNTALTSVDTSFENGNPGTDFATNTITLSFYLVNSGSIDADISAKFTTNYDVTYGLVSGTSTIGGSNFKLGNATLDALLDNGNSVDLTDNVPGEDTQRNYEVQLRVPAGQNALSYSGTIELTFSDVT